LDGVRAVKLTRTRNEILEVTRSSLRDGKRSCNVIGINGTNELKL
jgi:hypothetical protein